MRREPAIRIVIFTVAIAVAITAGSGGLSAQVVQEAPKELEGIDVVEHLGKTIPLDLGFDDDRGNAVVLADYFHQDKPVLLILGYYRCPMLCNLVFNGVAAATEQVGLDVYKDYQIVSVSINPEETPDLARAKKDNHLQQLNGSGYEDGWVFLTGSGGQSRRLADAIGFKYYWVEDRNEYAHPAVITLLSDKGKISRYLYGIQFDPRDLKLGLLEASEGKVGTTLDRIILSCFHYDPDAGSYVVFAGNVMKLGGAVTVVLLLGFISIMWVRERRRRVHHAHVRTETERVES